jgi:hypothetical protein
MVLDPGLGARLAQQPHRQAGVGAVQELDRDRAIEPAVARPVHRAHAAGAEQLEHLVAVPARHRRAAGDRRGRRILARYGREALGLRLRSHPGYDTRRRAGSFTDS